MFKNIYYFVTGKPHEELDYYTKLFDEASAALSARNLTEAEKKLQNIIKDIPRLINPAPQFLSLLAKAYLTIGHMRRGEQKNAEAVNAYLAALANIELPADVIIFCAQQLATQKMATPPAVRIYQLYLPTVSPKSETRDAVVTFLKENLKACFDPKANAAQIQAVIQLAKELLQAIPDLEWAHFSLGYSYGRLGDIPGSLTALRRAEELLPSRFATPFYIGYFALSIKDYPQAYQALTRSLAIQPQQSEACTLLARAILESYTDLSLVPAQKLGEAEEALQRSVDLNPRQAESWYLLGRVSSQSGKKRPAAMAFSKAAALAAGNYDYQVTYGNALAEIDQIEEAIKALGVAVTLNPQRFEGNFFLAELLYRWGQYLTAQQHYEAANLIQPGSEKVRIRLGGCHFHQQRYAETIRHLDPVQNHTPESIFQIGRAKSLTGDQTGAIVAFQKALSDYGDDANICYYLGGAQYRAGLISDAATSYHQAFQIGVTAPLNQAQAATACAIALLALNRQEDTIQVLKTLPEADARDPASLYLLGLAYVRLDRWDEAEQLLKQNHASITNSADLSLLSATVMEHKSYLKPAAQAYQKYLDMSPNIPADRQVQVTVRRGICLVRAGDVGAALPLLEPHGHLNAEVKYWLALALTRTCAFSAALPWWDQLAQAQPDESFLKAGLVYTLFELGQQALAAGNYSEAIALYERCQQVQPSAAAQCAVQESYFRHGMALLKRSTQANLTAARAALEIASRLDPDDVRARFYLAMEAVCSQEPDRALAFLDQLDAACWDENQVEFYRAVAFLQQKRVKEAREALSWLEARLETLPSAYRLLGASIFAQDQDWSAVLTHLQAGMLQSGEG